MFMVQWEAFGEIEVDAPNEDAALEEVSSRLSFAELGYLGSTMETGVDGE